MKTRSMLVLGIFVFPGLLFAEPQKEKFTVYTIRQRQMCLAFEDENCLRTATGHLNLDEGTLMKVYDSLRDHLYRSLDLSRCSDRAYEQDNLVFGFYDYYLQFIPFKQGEKRMVYINAYRAHCDIRDHGEESLPEKRFVFVFDGGSSYWQIIYDLDEDKFLELHINGHA